MRMGARQQLETADCRDWLLSFLTDRKSLLLVELARGERQLYSRGLILYKFHLEFAVKISDFFVPHTNS